MHAFALTKKAGIAGTLTKRQKGRLKHLRLFVAHLSFNTPNCPNKGYARRGNKILKTK